MLGFQATAYIWHVWYDQHRNSALKLGQKSGREVPVIYCWMSRPYIGVIQHRIFVDGGLPF